MAVTYISEAEAVRNMTDLLTRVRGGEEIVIKTATSPVSMTIAPFERRTISQSIAIAEALAKETGIDPVMDADFAADMREIIANRKPRNHSAWD